jgi:hypothetical protein
MDEVVTDDCEMGDACTAAGEVTAADGNGPPSINITISRRYGSVHGHDPLLPSSHVRILWMRPRGLWSPFPVRARGGGWC